MGKIFNIAGPCNPADHYMLPAMARLPKVMRLVEDKSYFVVHAQRQCGKTTALRTLAREIREMALGSGRLDLGGDWDAKLSHEDVNWSDKTVHLFRC